MIFDMSDVSYLKVETWKDLAGVAQADSTLIPMFSARLWM